MSKSRNLTAKKRTNSNNKCFNYKKLKHCGRDYILPDHCSKKSKSEKLTSFKQRQAKQNHANIAVLIDNNSDLELFRPSKTNIIKKKESSQQPLK